MKPTFKWSELQADLGQLMEIYRDQEENPFKKGAKMLPEEGEKSEWNQALALNKASSIIQAMPVRTVYKVYPLGSTPAFSDTGNLSLLNQKYTDPYVIGFRDNHVVFYEKMTPVELEIRGDEAHAPGFLGSFKSKSGDWDSLTRVLTIRKFMQEQFLALEGQCLLIPRWGSCSVFKL